MEACNREAPVNTDCFLHFTGTKELVEGGSQQQVAVIPTYHSLGSALMEGPGQRQSLREMLLLQEAVQALDRDNMGQPGLCRTTTAVFFTCKAEFGCREFICAWRASLASNIPTNSLTKCLFTQRY